MPAAVPGFIASSTLAQWLIALFTGGTFAAAFRFVLRWRGQSIDRAERLIDALGKRLDAKDEAILQLEKHWRDMSDQADRRYEECVKERDSDRAEIEVLRNEIRGLVRIIAQASSDKVLKLGATMSSEALAAAERVTKIISERSG